jgi:hypothetical protein
VLGFGLELAPPFWSSEAEADGAGALAPVANCTVEISAMRSIKDRVRTPAAEAELSGYTLDKNRVVASASASAFSEVVVGLEKRPRRAVRTQILRKHRVGPDPGPGPDPGLTKEENNIRASVIPDVSHLAVILLFSPCLGS